MINDELKIVSDITPIGKARPRVTRYGHAFTPKKTAEYESKVKAVARKAMREQGFKQISKEKEVVFTADYYYAPPKSWSKKKRKEYAENHYGKTTKPDLDNCGKGSSDALNKVVYKDDSSITEMHLRKFYAEKDGFTITVKAKERK